MCLSGENAKRRRSSSGKELRTAVLHNVPGLMVATVFVLSVLSDSFTGNNILSAAHQQLGAENGFKNNHTNYKNGADLSESQKCLPNNLPQ